MAEWNEDWRFDGSNVKVTVKFGERDEEVQLDVVASEKTMERNKLFIQKYPQQGALPPRSRPKPKHFIEVGLIQKQGEADN